MKLAVSHDEDGNIITLFDPNKLSNDQWTVKYVPAKDEKHYVLDVPKEFEDKEFNELPKLLRVNVSGKHPQLEPKA
jgi:hypothetical protein